MWFQVVTICAVISGADAWTEVEEYGEEKCDWLRSFLRLENGIPSHDTIGRVFSLLDPNELQDAFAQWVRAIAGRLEGVVAIDGKRHVVLRTAPREREPCTWSARGRRKPDWPWGRWQQTKSPTR